MHSEREWVVYGTFGLSRTLFRRKVKTPGAPHQTHASCVVDTTGFGEIGETPSVRRSQQKRQKNYDKQDLKLHIQKWDLIRGMITLSVHWTCWRPVTHAQTWA